MNHLFAMASFISNEIFKNEKKNALALKDAGITKIEKDISKMTESKLTEYIKECQRALDDLQNYRKEIVEKSKPNILERFEEDDVKNIIQFYSGELGKERQFNDKIEELLNFQKEKTLEEKFVLMLMIEQIIALIPYDRGMAFIQACIHYDELNEYFGGSDLIFAYSNCASLQEN